jgi:multimeric flavodoxin WrbA
MKITVFNGSPHGEKGNTHFMVQALAEGMQKAGAEVENIFLSQKAIAPCKGCFTCWLKTPGKCVIADDMSELLAKFSSSDILGFATPLYVDNVTGLMKNFMDRMIPILDARFEKDASGECFHKTRLTKIPKLMVISNSGFPEPVHFQVLSLLFKRIARNMQSELIAEIYRPGGAILANHPFILKPFIYEYRNLLVKAGEKIAKNLKLSPETIAALQKPIISDEQYIKGANASFDKILSRVKSREL